MIDNNNILAIIPARKGSKGLPNKNNKSFNGTTLIEHTITESLKSKYIDEIIVTTDSEKMRNIALKNRVSAPFLRPKIYSSDTASAYDVILHVLDYYKKKNIDYHYFVYLQPTSPLRFFSHINEAIERISNLKADSLVSVCEVKKHPIWMKKIDSNGHLKNISNDISSYPNRQSIDKLYFPNGAIYCSEVKLFLQYRSFYNNKTIPYIMDDISSIDIDTIEDFRIAEYFINNQ